jgi:hypothetical protein
MAVGQEPGWYADPWQQASHRWWNGQQWTSDVRTQPAAGPATPPPIVASAQGTAAAAVSGSPVVPWLFFGGAAAVVVGSLLPWAEVTAPFIGTVTKSGTDGDGVLTLIGALVIAGLGFLAFGSRRSRGAIIGSLVVAGLIALVAVVDMVDVSSRIADVEDQDLAVSASIGIGLWVVLLGAGVAIVGCVLRLTGPKGRAGV